MQPLLSSFLSSAAYFAVGDVAGLQRRRRNRHPVPISTFPSPRLNQQGIFGHSLVKKILKMCFKLGLSGSILLNWVILKSYCGSELLALPANSFRAK